MNKVIYLDHLSFVFRAIYSYEKNKAVPATYTYMSMIISALKKIGVEKDKDIIILAVDSKLGSWRKRYDKSYKAGRKEAREKHDVDWEKTWAEFNFLLDRIQTGTPIIAVEHDYIEADDIISVGCRYFKDKDNIIVSPDHDFFELTQYDNVKIFSPLKSYKSKKGAYVKVANPYKELSKKIQNEASDGLVSPIVTEEDYELRKKLVSLAELPEDVENPILTTLQNLKFNKEYDISKIPFKTMQERFLEIYNTKDVIDYELCINYKKRTVKKRRKQ